jgi:micrococcal nuclease
MPAFASDAYKCIDIIDGSTIVVEMNRQRVELKLIGIDDLEAIDSVGRFAFVGKKRMKVLKNMIVGKNVRLEYDSPEKDDEGHLLAYVYIENNSTSINAELIKQGYALVYSEYPFKYRKEFMTLQDEAKKNAIGLWRLDYDKTLFDYSRLSLDMWHLWLYIVNIGILLLGLCGVVWAGLQFWLAKKAQRYSAFLQTEKEFYDLDRLMLSDKALRQYYKMDDEYLEKATDHTLKQYIFYELYYGHLYRTYMTLCSGWFGKIGKLKKEYWPLYRRMLEYLLEDEVFRQVHKWSKDNKLFHAKFTKMVQEILEQKQKHPHKPSC